MIALDITIGYAATYLIEHAKSGATEKIKYICDRSNEEILVMGSSRGVHHYDPRIIQDSLGLSCYNCSYEGCGSITALGLLQIMKERHLPKIIIYDVYPRFDYLDIGDDYSKYLGSLKYFYDSKGIDSLFHIACPSEKWKINSWIYRLNQTLLQLVADNITADRGGYYSGYVPKNGKMRQDVDVNESIENDIDSIKSKCFSDIIQLCKENNITLILCASPCYKRSSDYEFEYVREIAISNGIPFYSHFCNQDYSLNIDYFYDSVHMNEDGATSFTKEIIKEIRPQIQF